jgi:type IV fimbrial biogenesis protein FimT
MPLLGILYSKKIYLPDWRKQSGLTIVELMVSIALVGIIISLALPSYRDMTEKRQLTQGAEQIFAFVNTTQGIASRTNSDVTVSYERTSNDLWCVGASLRAAGCDCFETVQTEADFCKIDDGVIQSGVMRLTNEHVGTPGIMESVTGDGDYAIDETRGLMVDRNDSLTMTLHSPSDKYRLRLIVSNTGHAVLCSVDDSHDIPGYAVCPPVVVEDGGS